MECTINNPALSLLIKHLVIGQRSKAPNFLAFHWSPHSSLVSIGQNFVTTRVVHVLKRTETSLITESDQSGPNHQLLQLCTARIAWSDSDQVVRAVHSYISWLFHLLWQAEWTNFNISPHAHTNEKKERKKKKKEKKRHGSNLCYLVCHTKISTLLVH